MTETVSEPREPSEATQTARGEARVGLRRRAVRASIWVLSSHPVGMALQTVRSLILTRLLFPEAFGLMAIVGVVMNGLAMVSDVGVNVSIVQHEEGDRREFLDTAWTMQIVRGLSLWVVCCAIAWPVAEFYEEPLLTWLLPVAGLTSVVMSTRSTAISSLRRKLQLGRLQVFSFGNAVAELLAMAAMAWWLRSVWGLVLGGLIGAVVYSISSHTLLERVKHRFAWHPKYARALIRFGRWILLSSALTFLARQGDKLLLGKLVDMEMLGIYSIGLVLAMMPRTVVTMLSSSVLFPAASEKAREDRAALDSSVARARSLVLRVAMLALAAVAIGGPVFFETLYDPRYWEAGHIARLLVIPAWFAILQATTSQLLLALGDVRSLAMVNLATFVTTWTFACAGDVLLGLPGFILGLGAGQLVGEAVIVLVLARHRVHCGRQDALFSIGVAALAGSAVGASVWIQGSWPDLPVWAIDSCIAAVWLGPLTAWLGRTSWREVFRR